MKQVDPQSERLCTPKQGRKRYSVYKQQGETWLGAYSIGDPRKNRDHQADGFAVYQINSSLNSGIIAESPSSLPRERQKMTGKMSFCDRNWNGCWMIERN